MLALVDREEASKALELLRSVVKQARDDSALQNWGVIWLLHALSNGGGFVATNVLLWRGHTDNLVYIGLWSGVLVVNFASIALLKKKRAGARTFIETQLYAIWLTFIGAVMLTAVINHLMKLPLFGLGPIISVLSGFGFAMMGATMGKRWFIGAAVFGAMALLMALLPRWQFILLGVVWGAMQLCGGIWLLLEKRKHQGDERAHLV